MTLESTNQWEVGGVSVPSSHSNTSGACAVFLSVCVRSVALLTSARLCLLCGLSFLFFNHNIGGGEKITVQQMPYICISALKSDPFVCLSLRF